MIRQRNIEPSSFVGIEEFVATAIALAASTQRFGTPVGNVQKIQLLDLIVTNDVATTGGGTTAITINRTNGNTVIPAGSTSEVLIATAVAADAGALGSRRYDLSNTPPIDGGVYANGMMNLNVKIIGTGTFTTGTASIKLRYRPFLLGKDA